MYSKEFEKSLKAVEAAREDNIALEPRRMTADEKDALLAAYHPDYKKSEFSTLKIGPNKGEQVPHELCEMLEAHSRIKADDVDLNDVTYDVDVLIIGGGGAGASAAIEADNAGAKTMIVTKLRIGDANTLRAVFRQLISRTIRPLSTLWTHSAAVISRQSASCFQSLCATHPRLLSGLTNWALSLIIRPTAPWLPPSAAAPRESVCTPQKTIPALKLCAPCAMRF